MRSLLPSTSAAELTDSDLEQAYAYPGERPWLRANMVMTADGGFSGPDGLTAAISGAADRHVFALLRRLSDVVLVGAGTVRAEGYRPAALPIAVVTNRLALDLASPLLGAAEHRTIILTSRAAPPERVAAAAEHADVVVCGDHRVEPTALLAALHERGLRRVLCEGGPTLLGSMAAAGILDELCLTLSTVLVGGRAGLLGPVPLPGLVPLRLEHLLEGDGMLFARMVVSDGR